MDKTIAYKEISEILDKSQIFVTLIKTTTMVKEKGRVGSMAYIDSSRDLRRYLENSPENTEMRFLAETAFNCRFSDIVIPYNKAEECVLIESHIFSNQVADIRDWPESREEVAKRCIKDQTTLRLTSTPIFIGTKKAKRNTHPDLQGEDFFKNTMVVLDPQGSIAPPFVWVKTKLLVEIFVRDTLIPHSQVYAYNHFMEYLRSF